MAIIDPDEALRRAVRAFYEGNAFKSMEEKTGKKVRYNKDFFDKYAEDLSKSKKKKGKDAEEEIEEETEEDEE